MDILSFSDLLKDRKYGETPVILTIGVFDGVHRGHRLVLDTLDRLRRDNPGSITMAITFSMNPKSRKAGELDTLRLRAREMSLYSVNSFTVIDFSENFSRISAVGFAESLSQALNITHLVVGDDFRCGHPSESADGPGFVKLLHEFGRNTELVTVPYVLDDEGEKISSTRLRTYIVKGEIRKYLEFAGDAFRIDLDPLPCRVEEEGIVLERISVHQLLPPPGAYDAECHLEDGKSYRCRLILDEEFLHLRAAEGSSVSGFEKHADEIMTQKDYISIIGESVK